MFKRLVYWLAGMGQEIRALEKELAELREQKDTWKRTATTAAQAILDNDKHCRRSRDRDIQYINKLEAELKSSKIRY